LVEEGETLSSIALKYYDSADKEKWMAIYEQNKDVIGDDPNMIKPGQRLKIPKLD
ncbi:MAG: LysM peptidoglycan-binding domain-containing protein, partial [Anaerolineae bacterium]|nr:LysM peptidoglycan-binding domain-containing protein [Anaerolineae bacterium]